MEYFLLVFSVDTKKGDTMYIKDFQTSMTSSHSETKIVKSNINEFKEYITINSTDNDEKSLSTSNRLTREFIIKELAKAIMRNLFLLYNVGFDNNTNSKNTYADLNEQVNDNITIVKTRYESSYTLIENESLNFQTEAFVKTDDKLIHVDIDLNLKRSFIEKTNITKTVECVDPLILSLNGNAPSLSDEKFSFDIDCDGKSDQISMLAKDSAFLSLDINGNGAIDDGGELFGAKSGDGFMDLKSYDTDGNNWIDEADDIFDKLQIWQKTENSDELIALGEAGIGAIFLGSEDTEFSIKSNENSLLGNMRKSGFFLNEDGTSGVISQIDLAKEDVETNDLKSIFKTKNKSQTNGDTSVFGQLEEKIEQMQNSLVTADEANQNILKEQIFTLNKKLSNLKELG